jgi:hypothetical protein
VYSLLIGPPPIADAIHHAGITFPVRSTLTRDYVEARVRVAGRGAGSPRRFK